MSARIMALPYRNFKQKIRITKKFEKMYHIEDFSMDSTVGILYMERREESEQSCINRKIN
ncbi:hypothetical protein [Clostridium tyrobutyricum]|uniref:hypothetical protein n=1 Tax=Clostridium tyrobutyricum TaxID=1519 RepID=UPI001C395837|nr:hypothetical protein [Clostridium tyrobutyricum]MBV4422943.1 hypothetical protein [Clostridium tyrobutyricum]